MQNQNSPSGSLSSDSSLDELLSLFSRKALLELDDMLPARVVSWDGKNKVQVEILYQVTMTNGDMHQKQAPAELPVQYPGGGGFILVYDLKPGDLGWVKAADRDMSLFQQHYNAQPGNTPRIHCFEDGVFIPDVMTGFSQAQAGSISIQTLDGSNAVVVSDSSVVLKAGAATLTLAGGKLISSVPFEAPAVKAGDLDLIGHTHPNPEGGDVGPAKNP